MKVLEEENGQGQFSAAARDSHTPPLQAILMGMRGSHKRDTSNSILMDPDILTKLREVMSYVIGETNLLRRQRATWKQVQF